METSQFGGVNEGHPPARTPIYEAAPEPARKRSVTADRVITGAVGSVALWMILAALGVPHIFGLGETSLLPAAAVTGALAGAARFDRLLVRVAAGSLLLLMLVAFTPIMEAPTARIVRRDPMPASADAIVVLSAGVSPDGMVRQQGLDRLLKGIELARAGIAPRLVLTREKRNVRGKWVTSDGDQKRLVSFAKTVVVTTGYSASTREEAIRVRSIAARGGWKRIVVVTSPFHSRRACATFEKAGLTVSCIPSESRDVSIGNLVGTGDRVRAFGLWTYELAGTIRYWAAGWI